MTEPPRWAGASEHIGLAFHGYSVTHLDALSHYFWDGRMYNDKPAAWVSSREGATWHAMNAVPEGIVTTRRAPRHTGDKRSRLARAR